MVLLWVRRNEGEAASKSWRPSLTRRPGSTVVEGELFRRDPSDNEPGERAERRPGENDHELVDVPEVDDLPGESATIDADLVGDPRALRLGMVLAMVVREGSAMKGSSVG